MGLKRSMQQPSDVTPGQSTGSMIDVRSTPSSRHRSLVEGEVIQPTDEAGNDPQTWTSVPSHWVSQIHRLAVYGQVRRTMISKGCC